MNSILLFAGTLLAATPVADPVSSVTAPAASPPVIVQIVLDYEITSATRDFLFAALAHAEAIKASALLVQLDTPGGLMEATREMVREVLKSEVPVIVYVAPLGARAASAGMFLTLAAHVAAMAPSTHIGAAHPVGLFGGNVEGDMAAKVVNDTVAWVRSLAQSHGRNMEWVEKAVRDSASIPAQEALDNHVIDLIADDVPALLKAVHGRTVSVLGQDVQLVTANATIEPFAMSGRQSLVTFLANPDLMYFLLLLGLFLLFLEFKNPGLIVPGVVGVLLMALVLGVQVLPVNWLGVLLILGAAALFVTELYATSFGLLAAGGLVCLIVGSYLLFDVPGSSFRVAPLVIWTVALTFSAVLLSVGFLLVRAKRQGPTSGVEAMAGEIGEVAEPIAVNAPGRIFVRGAYWTATCAVPVNKGTRVRIKHMDGLRAEVEIL